MSDELLSAPKSPNRLADAGVDRAALVSDLSHESRTLLGGILGLNELLLSTELSQHQRQLSQTIDQSSRTLLSMLNDIADLARIEIGKLNLNLSAENLDKVFEEAIQSIEPVARTHNSTLSVEIDNLPVLIVCDAARIRQLVSALVLRVIKAGESTNVKLRVNFDQTEQATQSYLQIEVRCESSSPLNTSSLKALKGMSYDNCRLDSSWLSLFVSRSLVLMMSGTCGCDLDARSCRAWARIPLTVPG